MTVSGCSGDDWGSSGWGIVSFGIWDLFFISSTSGIKIGLTVEDGGIKKALVLINLWGRALEILKSDAARGATPVSPAI